MKNYSNIILQKNKTSFAKNIYWVFGIVIKKNSKINSKNVQKELLKRNIQTRPFFWPMHKQDIFKKEGLFKGIKLKNSEFISKNGFYLPSGIGLKNQELKFIIKSLNSIL